MEKKVTKVFQMARLTAEEYAALKRLSRDTGATMSKIGRMAITQWLQAKGYLEPEQKVGDTK